MYLKSTTNSDLAVQHGDEKENVTVAESYITYSNEENLDFVMEKNLLGINFWHIFKISIFNPHSTDG